jgi:hypothetical protein
MRWAANPAVGRAVAASAGRSFNRRACPRKDFRRVFFLRKFLRNSVSFNVAEACVSASAPDAKPCAGSDQPPQLLRRKTSSCRKKNCAQRVAFSLPQDSSCELMFETCVNRRSELSAFRGFGFNLDRHVTRAVCRRHMHRKRLNAHPNLHARTRLARATSRKRLHRHGFPRQTTRCEAAKARRLPPLRRNVPEVRRKTPLFARHARQVFAASRESNWNSARA